MVLEKRTGGTLYDFDWQDDPFDQTVATMANRCKVGLIKPADLYAALSNVVWEHPKSGLIVMCTPMAAADRVALSMGDGTYKDWGFPPSDKPATAQICQIMERHGWRTEDPAKAEWRDHKFTKVEA